MSMRGSRVIPGVDCDSRRVFRSVSTPARIESNRLLSFFLSFFLQAWDGTEQVEGDASRDVDVGAMFKAAEAVPNAFQLGNWIVKNGYPYGKSPL